MADRSSFESVPLTAEYANTFKIMVATDCHLGYQENDPIIGDDSFVTFEEILQLSVEKQVDMILLGGDLFHHNNPSQQCLNRCMSLLRQYTMGNRPVAMELLSDAPIVLHEGAASVNYLDDNLNIAIPVFTIHGNHDDPSGVNHCSAMDTLASAGLVNYFGKWTDLSLVEIRPILLRKGTSYLALYGLSHIKDERLCRLYIEDKVKMARPKENPEKWFNIFVLHQNRVDRGPKRYIPEAYLHSFLDLVIWGHEHDCDILPVEVPEKGIFVTQPGSSVPTSLSEGETKPKHVGLLEIRGRQFKMSPLKLKTTRPFVFDTIRLAEVPVAAFQRAKQSEEISSFCMNKVEEMIEEAKLLLSGHPKQPKVPFVRLRCEFENESQLFNLVKFGQNFYQRVANPNCEIIKIKKTPQARDKSNLKQARADLDEMQEIEMEAPESFADCVEGIVNEYFENRASKKLTILSIKGMATAVGRYVDKNEANAIENICEYQRSKTLQKMLENDISDENVVEELFRLRDERCRQADINEDELEKAFEAMRGEVHDVQDNEVVLDSDEEQAFPPPKVSSSRGGKKTQTTIASMFAKNAVNYGDIEDDAEDWDTPAPPTRGRGRGRTNNRSVIEEEGEDPFDAPPTRARGRGRGSRGSRATTTRARGTRGRAAAKPLFTPQVPTRATPVRMAAASSQAFMKACQYQEEEFSD